MKGELKYTTHSGRYKDETGVSWQTHRDDGTIRQDNDKFLEDTKNYRSGEHIWYDHDRGTTGYRGAEMTDEDKKNYRELHRGY